MKKTIYLLITFFFLLACNDTRDISSEAIQASVTPSSTFSPVPSATQTLLATLTPTLIPAKATQDFLIDNYSSACNDPDISSIKTSPNKQWVSIRCYTQNGYSLNLITVNKSTKWELSYYEILGNKIESAEGYIYDSHWSKDGKFVYINAFPQLDGFGFAFAESVALYRLDLTSGELNEIISPDTSRRYFYSFGFSPNDRRLAYIESYTAPISLVIHDFQTGKNQTIAINNKYNTGGELIWSESNKLLVFTVATYSKETDTYTTSILLWDNEKKKLSTLIENSETALKPIKWDGDTKIVLQTMFNLSEMNYEFDLETNTLSPINP